MDFSPISIKLIHYHYSLFDTLGKFTSLHLHNAITITISISLGLVLSVTNVDMS